MNQKPDYKSIKEWREEERPVEKLLTRGTGALTNAELLAVLIYTGSENRSAVALAGEIMDLADNSLRNLCNTSKERILSVKGVGPIKFARLSAAFEIGRRMTSHPSCNPTITCPKDVADYMAPQFSGLDHEECWVLYLNRSNRIISKECISTGGISSTVMDIRIITKRAIEKMASGIILTHNHPSGNLRPGEQDLKVTAALREAAALLDIALLDHVIMGDNGKFYSFNDNC